LALFCFISIRPARRSPCRVVSALQPWRLDYQKRPTRSKNSGAISHVGLFADDNCDLAGISCTQPSNNVDLAVFRSTDRRSKCSILTLNYQRQSAIAREFCRCLAQLNHRGFRWSEWLAVQWFASAANVLTLVLRSCSFSRLHQPKYCFLYELTVNLVGDWEEKENGQKSKANPYSVEPTCSCRRAVRTIHGDLSWRWRVRND
jgi:hypothetical protein